MSAEPHQKQAERTPAEGIQKAPELTPLRRQSLLHKLIGFLRGSWRELQRVQWPDRPQVMQATGVVIGFVIVTAAFLGIVGLISEHIVKLILK